MEIKYWDAKRKIIKLWFIYSGVLLLFFFLQMILGRYNGIETMALEWFLPNILPYLALISTSLFIAKKEKNFNIKKLYSKLTLWSSMFYLIFLTIILISYSSEYGNIIGYYKRFDFFLKSLMPIVASFLGLFFSKGL